MEESESVIIDTGAGEETVEDADAVVHIFAHRLSLLLTETNKALLHSDTKAFDEWRDAVSVSAEAGSPTSETRVLKQIIWQRSADTREPNHDVEDGSVENVSLDSLIPFRLASVTEVHVDQQIDSGVSFKYTIKVVSAPRSQVAL